jgi:hypothetical protein
VVYRRWPYFVKDQVHIITRIAQISKEKRQSFITLSDEVQSIWEISRTLKVCMRKFFVSGHFEPVIEATNADALDTQLV